MPGADGGAEGIIVIDSMPGAYNGAQGIIIVDSMPGPGGSAEGIIIVNNIPGADDASQVMGIIMEDKPGEDGASQGIVVVDTVPGPGGGSEGLIWGGLTGLDGSAEGIIIVNTMPGPASGAEGIGWGSMPFGFDMEGMMAMMGDGGFGPGPYLFGRLELAAFGFPAVLNAGEESCIQVALLPIQGETLGGPDPGFPADSFFDIFFEIDPKKPQSVDSSSTAVKVVQIPIPSLPLCTPTPSPIIYTATPTRPPAGPPTNTPVYIRPTSTPSSRFVPTPTPGRG